MLTKKNIVEQLNSFGIEQSLLFEEAQKQRYLHFNNNVIVRGVIEITNLCRVNCDYCPMRKDNTKRNSTFIMSSEEIIKASQYIKALGLNVVFLQGGEIPQTTKTVAEAIPRIKELFEGDVEILLCLGDKSKAEYKLLRNVGADSYILKHETSDARLHLKFRHKSLKSRLRCIENLLDLGYKVGTGTIVGLPGQSLASIADDILLAQELGVHMVSVSPFIPALETPLEKNAHGSLDVTLNCIAAMRLATPHCLIPAVSALEVLKQDGQLKGLEAGANVLTINFSSTARQRDYLIYGKSRYIVKDDHVKTLLKRAGLIQSKSTFLQRKPFGEPN